MELSSDHASRIDSYSSSDDCQSFQLRDGPHYTKWGCGPEIDSDDETLSSCDFYPLASSSQSLPLDLDQRHDLGNFTPSTSSIGDSETIPKGSVSRLHAATVLWERNNVHLPFCAGSKGKLMEENKDGQSTTGNKAFHLVCHAIPDGKSSEEMKEKWLSKVSHATVRTQQGEVQLRKRVAEKEYGNSELKEGSISKQIPPTTGYKNQISVKKHRHEPDEDFSMLDVYIAKYKDAQERAAWRKQRDDAIQLHNPPRTVKPQIHSPVWLSAWKPPSGESLKRGSSERNIVTKKSFKHPLYCKESDTSWFK